MENKLTEDRKNQIANDVVDAVAERIFLNLGDENFELSDWEQKKVWDLAHYILKEHKL